MGRMSNRWAALTLGLLLSFTSFAANEVGYWNGGAGASSRSTFIDTEYANNNAADHYTCVTGDAVTHVRMHRFSAGTARTSTVAIRSVTGGVPDQLQHEVAVAVGAGIGEYGADTNWSCPNGMTITISIGEISGGFNVTADALATGTTHGNAPSNTFPTTWSPSTTSNFRMELAADITNTPSSGALLLRRRRS